MERLEKSAPKFQPILNRTGRKGAELQKKSVFFLFIVFPFTQTKLLFFLKLKSLKKGKITGWPNLFFSEDDYLHRTGRKVVSRVGNNDPEP
jgi:hypothetical protein